MKTIISITSILFLFTVTVFSQNFPPDIFNSIHKLNYEVIPYRDITLEDYGLNIDAKVALRNNIQVKIAFFDKKEGAFIPGSLSVYSFINGLLDMSSSQSKNFASSQKNTYSDELLMNTQSTSQMLISGEISKFNSISEFIYSGKFLKEIIFNDKVKKYKISSRNNNSIKVEEIYSGRTYKWVSNINIINNQIVGIKRKNTQNGKTLIEETYKYTYFPNGNLKSETIEKKDKAYTNHYEYYENNLLKQIESKEKGIPTEATLIYYIYDKLGNWVVRYSLTEKKINTFNNFLITVRKISYGNSVTGYDHIDRYPHNEEVQHLFKTVKYKTQIEELFKKLNH